MKIFKINNSSGYLKFIGIVVLISFLVYAIINILFSKDIKVVKKRTDYFIELYLKNDIDSIKLLLSDSNYDYSKIDLIKKYEICGHGIIALNKIQIEYYVEGKPADQRNIHFFLSKNNGNWTIDEIYINWHIDRNDKNLAENFVKSLYSNQKFDWNKINLSPDYIQNIQVKINESIQPIILSKGIPIMCTGKNCANKPVETEFIFCTPDNKIILHILTQRTKNESKIVNVWID